MKVDARTQLIWRVRGQLGAEGHLVLANNPRNPAEDADLRARLVGVCANIPASRFACADDRGLLRHGRGQYTHEFPTDVVTWQQVWDLVSPGITPERTAELNAAWRDGAMLRALDGQHMDLRLHHAQCAFYDSPPGPEQLDLLDLFGVIA